MKQAKITMRCQTLSQLPPPPRGKSGWPWTEESPRLSDNMPDGNTWPRISIATPSYNQGRFIEETIRSVLLQGYPNFEYIIIDGGSTDNSIEIIKKYEEWLTYWVSEPDRGQSDAINKGLAKATGEIFAWLNSDDYLLKDALMNIASAYYTSPEAGAWCGGCIHINAKGKPISTYWPRRVDVDGIADWYGNLFAQSACFFSRKAWHECGPLDEDLQYGMDFDLWLKIAKAFSFEKVGNIISVDHIHKDAKTQKVGQLFADIFLVQVRHGYESLAIQEISRLINYYMALSRKLHWISRFSFIKTLLSVFKKVDGNE